MVVAMVQTHADGLLRLARRHSICADDAHDAYQRGLEIFLRHASRLDPERAPSWLRTVVKHEAMAVRRMRQRDLGPSELVADAIEERNAPSPEERAVGSEHVDRAAEALKRCKPQEVRALWLQAEGNSYDEIQEITGWTRTKVNRCLYEGRRAFLARYAGIEAGDECGRWAPLLSALVDGEATTDELVALRPHLRNCGACRSARARASPRPRAAGRGLPRRPGRWRWRATTPSRRASCSCASTSRSRTGSASARRPRSCARSCSSTASRARRSRRRRSPRPPRRSPAAALRRSSTARVEPTRARSPRPRSGVDRASGAAPRQASPPALVGVAGAGARRGRRRSASAPRSSDALGSTESRRIRGARAAPRQARRAAAGCRPRPRAANAPRAAAPARAAGVGASELGIE